MALVFLPHPEDAEKGTLSDRVETLMDAAERYKTQVLDTTVKVEEHTEKKLMVPRDIKLAYNWEEIARVMREIREMPEASSADRLRKSDMLKKLSEIYEVLRAAKMSKLEAVRLALMSESQQLRGSGSAAPMS